MVVVACFATDTEGLVSVLFHTHVASSWSFFLFRPVSREIPTTGVSAGHCLRVLRHFVVVVVVMVVVTVAAAGVVVLLLFVGEREEWSYAFHQS